MKTIITRLCLATGLVLLGGCGIIATDYMEMGAYIRTTNKIFGEIKGKTYCFLPTMGQEESTTPADYLGVLRGQFEKIGMKEVSAPGGVDFVVAVAYGLGEERMFQMPEKQIITGGSGPALIAGSGGFSDSGGWRPNLITPTMKSMTTVGGGVAVGKVKILALALIDGKEWQTKGDASTGCYSGAVVVYGGGEELEKLFPRMAGYLFEGFPGKKKSERVETFRMRTGKVAGEEKSKKGLYLKN